MGELSELSYYFELSKLFNFTFFKKVKDKDIKCRELHHVGKNKLFLDNSKITFDALLSKLYQEFIKTYRCEYIYKNEIIKEIYISRKEKFEDVFILNEFKINYSKADFFVLNGHSTIYEIKTDLDNFQRLEGQLSDYLKVAQYVNVVTAPKFVTQLLEELPKEVGLIVFTESGKLETVRHPIFNKKINFDTVFSTLNNKEHKNLISEGLGEAPDVINTLFYNTYLKLFNSIEKEKAYDLYIKILKKRRLNQFNPIGNVPEALLGIALNQKNKTSHKEFLTICNKEFILQ